MGGDEVQFYRLIRPLLFVLNPEWVHGFVLRLLKCLLPPVVVKKLRCHFTSNPIELWGLSFPNRVGLAAGFDKNGDCIDSLLGLGFGFIEVGAVTPEPQVGNPKPRLFRKIKQSALINRMGFNNYGVDYLVSRLKERKVPGIVGVNIGKNAKTSLENALSDYRVCFEKIYPYADFVTINVSSPNTPELRNLQQPHYLKSLLTTLKSDQQRLKKSWNREVPLFVKISPDLDEKQSVEMIKIFVDSQIDAVIATNTLPTEEGGLSGEPLFSHSYATVSKLVKLLPESIPVIAVGGIDSPERAFQMLSAGAKLVQIYTGLIYQGPKLVTEILKFKTEK